MTADARVPVRPQVAIIGAGPVGLEAALAAAERGWPVTVYEAGPAVGTHVRQWGHVRLFTQWSMNVSPRASRALGASLDGQPDRTYPTGDELVDRLLEPLAAAAAAAGASIRTGLRVDAISRLGLVKSDEIGTGRRAARPFRLLLAGPAGEGIAEADVVLDASGTWGQPNALGDGGIPAVGERALAGRILRSIPSPDEIASYAGKRILLVGSGYSAQTAVRLLAALIADPPGADTPGTGTPGSEVVWVVREAEPTWGAVTDDPLPDRAALAAHASAVARGEVPGVTLRTATVVESLAAISGGRIAVTVRERDGSATEVVEVDQVLSLTGSVGDASIYRQLQIHECYATAAPMNLSAALLAASGAGGDCLTQQSHGVDVLRSPEPDFFILGAKSYGRNTTFLLRVGWEQVEEVMAALEGEWSAAPAAASAG